MKYLPKSKYTGDLYSRGDLAIATTLDPYVGYYYELKSGECFTGKYPGDGPNTLLTRFSQNIDDTDLIYNTDPRLKSFNLEYSKLQYPGLILPPITSPIPYYPNPLQSDYQTGEFIRYFSKRINENIYTETSALFENDLYIGIQVPWLLTGDKDKVYQTNENMVMVKEQQLQISGLGAYLNFNYLKFYKE